MFVINPQSILLVVPRNVVTAVGLPLAAGFYSGSHTREVVRGAWYNVRWTPSCGRLPIDVELTRRAEPAISTRSTSCARIPHRVDYSLPLYVIVSGDDCGSELSRLLLALGYGSHLAYEAWEDTYMTEDL